jgi:hypothetical protein
MGDLRRIPFFVSVILIFLVVAVETGSGLAKSNLFSSDRLTQMNEVCAKMNFDHGVDISECLARSQALGSRVSGLGVRYLALVDGVLLFFLAFMTLALLVPESITGRIQGIATLIFALLLLLLAISMILAAIAKLTLMLGLLLSPPFGTIAYFAIFAFFPKAAMLGLLSTVMLFKIGMAVALVLAQQRFLQNKMLVLLILSSLVASLVVSFLLGFLPGFLTSITDAVAAIIVGIIAVIWLLILIILAIPAILKAISLRQFNLLEDL